MAHSGHIVKTKEEDPDITRADIPTISMYRPDGYNEMENKKEEKEEKRKNTRCDR